MSKALAAFDADDVLEAAIFRRDAARWARLGKWWNHWLTIAIRIWPDRRVWCSPPGLVAAAALRPSAGLRWLTRCAALTRSGRVAEQETNWRSGYLTHLRRRIEAGLASRAAALAVASAGLDSLYRQMRVIGPDGTEQDIGSLSSAAPRRYLRAVTVTGQAEPQTELILPYRGRRLGGTELSRQLDAWARDGIIEPSCADAVRTVAAHPQWLSLPGRTVAVLGAGSEIGPLPVLLSWGATVAGVDLRVRSYGRPSARALAPGLCSCRSGRGPMVRTVPAWRATPGSTSLARLPNSPNGSAA